MEEKNSDKSIELGIRDDDKVHLQHMNKPPISVGKKIPALSNREIQELFNAEDAAKLHWDERQRADAHSKRVDE